MIIIKIGKLKIRIADRVGFNRETSVLKYGVPRMRGLRVLIFLCVCIVHTPIHWRQMRN